MKTKSFYILALLWILTGIFCPLFGQKIPGGFLYMDSYTQKHYKAAPQILGIAQDTLGVMYFANADGVLRYDGLQWLIMPMPQKEQLYGIDVDAKGRLYAAGVNQLGYFAPDSSYGFSFVSLLDKLPKKYQNPGPIRQVVALRSKTVFRTANALFIYEKDAFTVIEAKNKFHVGLSDGIDFFIREPGAGLFRLNDNKLDFISGSERLADEKVYVLLPWTKNTYLISTSESGLMRMKIESKKFNPTAVFSPFNTDSDGLILEGQAYSGTLTKTGFALGTQNIGVLVFDKEGKLIDHINAGNGLNQNSVLGVLADGQGHLWVGTDNGANYLHLNSPFRYYDHQEGLLGTVYSALLHDSILYVGTSQGVFYQSEQNYFEPVAGIASPCWGFYETGEDLLAMTNSGLYSVSSERMGHLIKNSSGINFWALSEHHKDDKGKVLLTGTTEGIGKVIKTAKGWEFTGILPGFSEKTEFLVKTTENTVWASDLNKGPYRILLSPQTDRVLEKVLYDENKGLPSSAGNRVYSAKGKLYVASVKGLYEYDHKKDRFALLPLKGLSEQVDCFAQAPDGSIWIEWDYHNGEYGKGIVGKASNDIFSKPFHKLKLMPAKMIYPLNSKMALFCTTEALVKYDESLMSGGLPKFNSLVPEVKVKDSLTYGGIFLAEPQKYEFKHNSLTFSFAATFYESMENTLFSYRLVGLDDKWSKWVDKNEVQFTNLEKGVYRFEIKAKNVYGDTSVLGTYPFEILPPWYQTFLYYVIQNGFVLFLLLISFMLNRTGQRSRLSEILTYISILITFEFIVLQLDPLVDNYSDGVPFFKLCMNIILAFSLDPIEAFVEKFLTRKRKVGVTLDNISVSQNIFYSLRKAMQVDVFGVGVYNDKTKSIEFPDTIENGKTLAFHADDTADADSLSDWCYTHKEDILIGDLETQYKKYLKKMPLINTGEMMSSVVYLPLISDKKCIGVLTVQTKEKNAYSEREISIIRALTHSYTAGIEVAQIKAADAEH